MKRVALSVVAIFCLSSVLVEASSSFGTKGGGGSKTRKLASSKSFKNAFIVTLTTYWAVGRGSDYWTRRFTSATGQRLVPGLSVAADPKVIPYGSIIEIEGVGRRVVKDTGTHVIQRVASRKRGVDYPVIDLFFKSRQEALAFARKHPPFAEVKIIKTKA